jgi:hypothetical protein
MGARTLGHLWDVYQFKFNKTVASAAACGPIVVVVASSSKKRQEPLEGKEVIVGASLQRFLSADFRSSRINEGHKSFFSLPSLPPPPSFSDLRSQ